jgi:hypothetical protein
MANFFRRAYEVALQPALSTISTTRLLTSSQCRHLDRQHLHHGGNVTACAVSVGGRDQRLYCYLCCCSVLCAGAPSSEVSALAHRAVPATIECHV